MMSAVWAGIDAENRKLALRKRRISKLQLRIIDELAKRTINNKIQMVPYRELRDACLSHWSEGSGVIKEGSREYATACASFSRTTQAMVKASILGGLALAWLYHCGPRVEDLWGWQGDGRRRKGSIIGSPKYRAFILGDKGWQIWEQRHGKADSGQS